MARTYLLAGGGTGGHVNPLLATAAELVARGNRVVALGTREGLEADLVPRAGLELKTIPRAPAPRQFGRDALRFPGRLRRALAQAREVVDDVCPDAVVGFGGYVSMPAYAAARKRGVPVVVHEANARPGLANRLGARWASAVAVTVPGTPLRGAVVTGLPLRREIADLAVLIREGRAAPVRASARTALGWPDDAMGVLIMGGSLGAARLNAAVAEAIPAIVGHGIHVIHLTGRGKDDDAERALGDLAAKHRRQYVLEEYAFDMASAFAAVDAVVCRAGAATVAEVSALALPALYVPLPIGNGEQKLNAAPAVAAGAATLVEDRYFTAAALTLGLESMLLDQTARDSMLVAASGIGIIDGAARLADLIEGVVR